MRRGIGKISAVFSTADTGDSDTRPRRGRPGLQQGGRPRRALGRRFCLSHESRRISRIRCIPRSGSGSSECARCTSLGSINQSSELPLKEGQRRGGLSPYLCSRRSFSAWVDLRCSRPHVLSGMAWGAVGMVVSLIAVKSGGGQSDARRPPYTHTSDRRGEIEESSCPQMSPSLNAASRARIGECIATARSWDSSHARTGSIY